jgi:ADP-ribosylarginine hydrolase
MEDRFIATLVLHALGDTIGFNNGIWEFNFNYKDTDIRITLEIISDFIRLGGINGIDLKDWYVSDDTLLNYEIAKSLLDKKFDIYKLRSNINEMYKKELNNKKINRRFGFTTMNAIKSWEDKDKLNIFEYDPAAGGNGCAMRTQPIGLRLYKKESFEKLVELSIITSIITHSSPIGYLSGVASAYFTSLAINNVKPEKWCKLFIDTIDNNKLFINIIKNYNGEEDYDSIIAYKNFVKIFKYYYEIFYDEKTGAQLELKTKDNLMARIKLFQELEMTFIQWQNSDINLGETLDNIVGSSGPIAVIMALQALIDCDGKWEKLVFYSMLHGGDSDTVGSIAGGFYGAIYGFGDVPENLLKHLELKEELTKLGKEIYEKTLVA